MVRTIATSGVKGSTVFLLPVERERKGWVLCGVVLGIFWLKTLPCSDWKRGLLVCFVVKLDCAKSLLLGGNLART